MTRVHPVLRWILAVFFIVAGANHFRNPAIYYGMMPAWVIWPVTANVVSGLGEILGGIGLLVSATRRLAGWGLIVLLIAVFPANVHVALQGQMLGTNLAPAILWVRLPFQVLFVAAVWWVAVKRPRDNRQTRGS